MLTVGLQRHVCRPDMSESVWPRHKTRPPRAADGWFYKLYLIEDLFNRFPVLTGGACQETSGLAADSAHLALTSSMP